MRNCSVSFALILITLTKNEYALKGAVEVGGVPEYNYSQYWVTYHGVPQDACQTFAQGLLNTAVALNVGGIQVSFNTDPTNGWKANEVRVENIGQGCNTASSVTIIAQYAQ